MEDEEKIGGLPIYHNEMEDFSCCINSYELVDINFKGCPLTLWNGRPDQGKRAFQASGVADSGDVVVRAHAQYYKYLKLQQEFSRQKVGIQWFLEGDKNTEFLHNLVKDRRKRLKISRIQTANGSWEDENKVLKKAVSFYKDQFSSNVEEDDTSVINIIPSLVNEEDNALLNRYPSFAEVRKVVFELKGESATELDGFIGKGPSILDARSRWQVFHQVRMECYEDIWGYTRRFFEVLGEMSSFQDLFLSLEINQEENFYSIIPNQHRCQKSWGILASAVGEMWKKKNKLKHGEKMTLDKMVAEIDRNIHRIATAPNARFYKSTTNGASKGNPGPSAGGFRFRDWKGVKIILEAEAMALQKGLLYYLENQSIPVSMEIDSRILSKILKRAWDVPWCISPLITKIRWLMRNEHVEVKHVSMEGIEDKVFKSFKKVPREGKARLILDAQQGNRGEKAHAFTNKVR
ncbi:hypothetical protein KY290_005290 [Solanum tuberosum]|uniref:RNase H family protein n=1 Tax=Solanum tuberosum TaxID=4113 RepID=A0ABQ7WDT7_SOLTU|nr:hypothetical protein KY289_005677 [Solanum tuberosum]KAH0778863.1 hypothetical protein KY290_005290 [Solanum tuberosum]